MNTKKKAKTRADLLREIRELHAQLVHVYHFADAELHKCGTDRMMASGVLVTLTANGGRELVTPFMVKDGLSAETIAGLRADIARSYELATAFKPKRINA